MVRIGAYTNIQDGTVIDEAFEPLSPDHEGTTIIGHYVTVGLYFFSFFFFLFFSFSSLPLFGELLGFYNNNNNNDNKKTKNLPINKHTYYHHLKSGHGCVLRACTIEDECHLGMGSIVMDGAYLEQNVMLGANTVVQPGTRIPSGQVFFFFFLFFSFPFSSFLFWLWKEGEGEGKGEGEGEGKRKGEGRGGEGRGGEGRGGEAKKDVDWEEGVGRGVGGRVRFDRKMGLVGCEFFGECVRWHTISPLLTK